MSNKPESTPAQEGAVTEPKNPRSQEWGERDTGTGEERTFTQEELNRIVAERIAKEKAKADALLAQKEQEITKREYDHYINKTLEEKKLSPRLLEILKADDVQQFDQSIATLEEIMQEMCKNARDEAVMELTRGTTPRAGSSTAIEGDEIRGAMGLDK